MALVVTSLVFFQRYAHQAKEDQKAHNPDEQARAQRALFDEEEERHEVSPGILEHGTAAPENGAAEPDRAPGGR
jgi:hypothetical protein